MFSLIYYLLSHKIPGHHCDITAHGCHAGITDDVKHLKVCDIKQHNTHKKLCENLTNGSEVADTQTCGL